MDEKYFKYFHEWDNGFDNCLQEERYYTFGSYIDLCGMSVEDALAAQNGCCCNGSEGGGGNVTPTPQKKTNNVLISTAPSVDGEGHEVTIKFDYEPTSPVVVSFTIDNEQYTYTATSSNERTGIVLPKKYATVSKLSVISNDESYKYEVKTDIKDGKYKVTYILDGKTYSSVTYTVDDNVVVIPMPEREGYTFSEWDKKDFVMPEGNVTVRGEYVPNPYEITYVIDEDMDNAEKVVVLFDKPISAKTPVKDGYTFSGWKLEDGNDVPSKMPSRNLVAKGTFTINTYDVNYYVDGILVHTEQVTFNDAIPEYVYTETKEGHKLSDWTFDGYDAKPDAMPSKNVKVNATFDILKYTVKFIIDGTEVYSEELDFGTKITAPTDTDKEGYTFIGWTPEVDATVPSHDVSYEAQYEVNEYTITYIINIYKGGELVSSEQYGDVETVGFGSAVTLRDLVELEGRTVRNSDVNNGWVVSDGSEMPTTMPSKDIEVVCEADTNKYRLGFIPRWHDLNDNEVIWGGAIQMSERYYGDNLIEASNKDTFKKGELVFVEYQNPSFEKVEDIKSETMGAGDINYYVFYNIAEYKITYSDTNRAIIKEVYYKFGQTINLIDVPESYEYNGEIVYTNREGYSIDGWTTRLNTFSPVKVNAPTTMPSNNLALYIYQPKNIYTVNVYDKDDVLIKTIDAPYTNNISNELTSLYLNKGGIKVEGFKFLGWNEENGDLPIAMPLNGGDYRPVYEAIVYTITYNVEGEEPVVQQYLFGDTVEAYVPEVREGYDSPVWDVEIPETMPSHDIVVNGAYKVQSYDIVFVIEDEEVSRVTYDYGTELSNDIYPSYEEREGYEFAWDMTELPSTMPAEDITVNGAYTVKTYHLTITVDGEVKFDDDVEYGSDVVMPEVEEREGYDFAWDKEEIPATMPAEDVTINGIYTVRVHTLTFIFNEEVISETEVEYGSEIVLPEVDEKEGFAIKWEAHPDTMPDSDLTISGEYVEIKDNVYYGSILLKDFDGVDYANVFDSQECNKAEGNIVTFANAYVDMTEEESDYLDDFEGYLHENKCVHIILLPTSVASFTIKEKSNGVNVTNLFHANSVVNVEGTDYNVYVRDREDEGEQFYPTFKDSLPEIYDYIISF